MTSGRVLPLPMKMYLLKATSATHPLRYPAASATRALRVRLGHVCLIKRCHEGAGEGKDDV